MNKIFIELSHTSNISLEQILSFWHYFYETRVEANSDYINYDKLFNNFKIFVRNIEKLIFKQILINVPPLRIPKL